MEKKEPLSLHNGSTSLLILPNGYEIQPGATFALPDEFAGNLGVQMWIDDGLLVPAGQASEPVADPE